jgi:hypothetical protein
MPVSELKLVKRCVEFCEISEIRDIPSNTRGIYVLFKRRRKLYKRSKKWREKYDVVYEAADYTLLRRCIRKGLGKPKITGFCPLPASIGALFVDSASSHP